MGNYSQVINIKNKPEKDDVTLQIGKESISDPLQVSSAFSDYFIKTTNTIREKISFPSKHFSEYLINKNSNSIFFRPISLGEDEVMKIKYLN